MTALPWTPEAAQLLAAANDLFPDRYHPHLDQRERWQIIDERSGRCVGLDHDPLQAARTALTSARLSHHKVRLHHTPGRTIHLPAPLWTRLDAEAARLGWSVSQLIEQRMEQTLPAPGEHPEAAS
ncbi:hypothetical protein [Deinococcus sonorensis]|uniref:Uncharacterized protein n=2 Tax=Deinococcus sonorensis TaxID=309891 RepID=A0AAU7UE34_9DEIO